MGLISGLLLLPITGPVRGLQFIIEQIQAEADAALLDQGRIQAELANLSLAHDLGEVSDEEYLAREAELLAYLNAVRAHEQAAAESDPAEMDPYDDGDGR